MGWKNPSQALKLIVPDPGGIIRDIQSDVDTSLYMETQVYLYIKGSCKTLFYLIYPMQALFFLEFSYNKIVWMSSCFLNIQFLGYYVKAFDPFLLCYWHHTWCSMVKIYRYQVSFLFSIFNNIFRNKIKCLNQRNE